MGDGNAAAFSKGATGGASRERPATAAMPAAAPNPSSAKKESGLRSSKLQSPGLASSGLSTSKASGPADVACGTFWRSVKKDAKISSLGLSTSADGQLIDEWMRKNRDRGIQLLDFRNGAEVVQKLATVPQRDVHHHLRVKLLSGRNLMAADDTGKSDPYVDFFAWSPPKPTCKHMWRSHTIEQDLDPVWDNEDQRVDLLTVQTVLHVVCFDWDRFGNDDFLGECLLDLSKYADGTKHRLKLHMDQYNSQSTEPDVEVTGHLEVELQMTPVSKP